MMKTTLTLLATALLAASPAFAGDKTCCATEAGKMECSKIYAKLSLTPEQKTQLNSFQETCMKEGCTDGSMQKFFASAKEVLSAEQYAQLKAECTEMEKHAPPAGS